MDTDSARYLPTPVQSTAPSPTALGQPPIPDDDDHNDACTFATTDTQLLAHNGSVSRDAPTPDCYLSDPICFRDSLPHYNDCRRDRHLSTSTFSAMDASGDCTANSDPQKLPTRSVHEPPREMETMQHGTMPLITADLSSVAEAISKLPKSSAVDEFDAAAEEQQRKQDEANRAQAWDHLKHLETFYRQFTERIFELKAREIDSVHQTITNGTHHELVADVCKLEDQRVGWLQSTKWRHKCQQQAIEREHAAACREAVRTFQVKKAAARRKMQRRLFEMQRKLLVDHEEWQRKRMGQRVDALKDLFPRDEDDMLEDKVEHAVGCDYHSAAVDQFVWQQQRNSSVLDCYESTRDQFDARVPPPLSPGSLQNSEMDADLDRLKHATSILNAIQTLMPTPAVSDCSGTSPSKQSLLDGVAGADHFSHCYPSTAGAAL